MLALLLLLSFFGYCNTTLRCIADEQGRGGATSSCVFPFYYEGREYNTCIPNVTAGSSPWCPTQVDYTTHVPVHGKWGNCNCVLERVCDEFTKISAPKGTVDTFSVSNLHHPILNCTWLVVNPSYDTLTVPTIIFFAMQYTIDVADVFARDNKDRHQIMSVRGGKNVGWTTEREFWVHLQTPSAGSTREIFHGSFYSGFCSDVDGDMDIPAYDLRISEDPYIPLITDKYLIPGNHSQLNGTTDFNYRPHAYCGWKIPAYPAAQVHRTRTLYFYKFDLGAGDYIEVYLENRYKGMQKMYTFSKDNPPVPITSTKKMQVSFISDAEHEGLGFQADIYREACSPRTVDIQAPYGVITDGTSPGIPYRSDQSCSWRISRPGEIIYLELAHYRFFPNDLLSFFEGTDLDGKLLAVYSGNSSEVITLTGKDHVFITFNTQTRKNDYDDYGFRLVWNVCDKKCQACTPGTYYDFEKSSCTICPSWTISKKGSYKCYACPVGHKWTSPSQCDVCPPGSSSTDGKACVECATGLVAEESGMTACLPCKNNTYSMNGTFCATCSPGWEANSTGNGCSEIPVPPTPKNNTAVLIYGGVGIAVLLLIGAGIGYTQWKKNRTYSNDYLPLPSFE